MCALIRVPNGERKHRQEISLGLTTAKCGRVPNALMWDVALTTFNGVELNKSQLSNQATTGTDIIEGTCFLSYPGSRPQRAHTNIINSGTQHREKS